MSTTELVLDERTTEHALVAGAEQGHEAAFDELYRRHADSAWRLGLAVTRNPHDAADVVSESFAKVFTAIRAGRYAADAPFRPYLLTTARNAAIDVHRSRARVTVTDDAALFDNGADAVDPGDSVTRGEDADMIAAAFANLPERWRSVLWLSEVEGLKPRDIAPIVGLSANATAQLAVRARRGLREQYLQAHLTGTAERDCSRTVKRLGAYVAGSMTPGDRTKIETHIASCDACTVRHAELIDVSGRLRGFALPLPMLLIDDVRSAWMNAIAVSPVATGTGLSETTEKVLAGVSAAAAVLGVLGATLFGFDRGTSADETAAPKPIAPIVTEAAGPQPDLGAGIDLITDAAGLGSGSGTGAPHSLDGASLPRSGSATDTTPTGTTPDSGDAAPGPAAPGSPAADPAPITSEGPGSEGPVHVPLPNLAPPSESSSPTPSVTVGTTVADIPVAVEVSDDPGLTAGPVSAGSAPAPGDEPIEVTSPSDSTEETDPVATTVDTVDTTTDVVVEDTIAFLG